MAKKVFWVAAIAAATTYVAYHISFTRNLVWSNNAAVMS